MVLTFTFTIEEILKFYHSNEICCAFKNIKMHQSIPEVSIYPGISGAFFNIIPRVDRALVYPWAFDRHVVFTS